MDVDIYYKKERTGAIRIRVSYNHPVKKGSLHTNAKLPVSPGGHNQ
jgi:hypothetical protein